MHKTRPEAGTLERNPMSVVADLIAAGGVNHALLVAQSGADSVMHLAVDLGTSQEGQGGVVSRLMHWVWTILTAVAGVGFFGRAAFSGGKDIKSALMMFGGGLLITGAFIVAPRLFGLTESVLPI